MSAKDGVDRRTGLACVQCDGLVTADQPHTRCRICREAVHTHCVEEHLARHDRAEKGKTSMAKKKATGGNKLKRIVCKFSGVAIGRTRAAIGIAIDGKAVQEKALSKLVVDATLLVKMVSDPNQAENEVNGQEHLIETQKATVEVEATCSGLAVKPTGFSFRLAMKRQDVGEIQALADLAQMPGFVTIERTGDRKVEEEEPGSGDVDGQEGFES